MQVITESHGEHQYQSYKGRIGDESGSIEFEIRKNDNREIKLNDIVEFANIANKVNAKNFHYVTIGKPGFYTVFQNQLQINTDSETNRSTIQYVKAPVNQYWWFLLG